MDFNFTDEQEQFRDALRRYLDNEYASTRGRRSWRRRRASMRSTGARSPNSD